MARSCGIRLGPRRYEVVVLDGGAKRHRITAFKSAEFDPHADDPVHEAIKSVKAAVKELDVPRDNVALVIDSGHAAFRHLTLPFSDRAKIDQVIKYEVEAQLPQWNIDDVIVDYQVTEGNQSASELLVTAVPKDDLQASLEVLEGTGVEPLDAELETSAMVNAACAAEICSVDDAQLLVHIGDHSTSVVVMDGGKVREMRVIHIGALTHEVTGPPPSEPDAEEDEDQGEDDEGAPPPLPAPEADAAEVGRRVEAAIKRIRRELGRTLSAARTVHPIEAIYICGMELPGLVGSSVLDVPVYILDCFEEDGGQPADGFGELVVAYGAAYRLLGGGILRPSLRREELRYAGTWERIEFPLAVASLMLVTLLGVIYILQMRKLEYQEDNGFAYWLRSSNVYMVGPGGAPSLYPVPDEIVRLVDLYPPDASPPKTDVGAQEILRRTRRTLFELQSGLEKELGQDASIKQPQSAMVGAFLVLDVLREHQKEWRPGILRVQALTEEAKGNNPEAVKVTLDIVFFAENDVVARGHYEDFRDAVSAEPWCLAVPERSTTPLENGAHVVGQQVSVDADWFYEELHRAAGSGVQ